MAANSADFYRQKSLFVFDKFLDFISKWRFFLPLISYLQISRHHLTTQTLLPVPGPYHHISPTDPVVGVWNVREKLNVQTKCNQERRTTHGEKYTQCRNSKVWLMTVSGLKFPSQRKIQSYFNWRKRLITSTCMKACVGMWSCYVYIVKFNELYCSCTKIEEIVWDFIKDNIFN